MPATFPKAARKNMLAIEGGAAGANLRVRLFKNNPTIDQDTDITDLVQADFDGYSEFSTAGWSAPAIDDAGDAFILSPVIVFEKSAGIATNTVYGYYLVYDDGVNPALLLLVEKFTAGIGMNLDGDQVPLRVKYAKRPAA